MRFHHILFPVAQFFSRALFKILAFATAVIISHSVNAGEIYMEPGDSQLVSVGESIGTLFLSSPKVADYEIVSDTSLIVYAKENGRSDLNVLGKSGDPLLKITLIVDPMLGAVQKRILDVFPDSRVTLQKLGQIYVLSGTVTTEEDKDRVYQIVGEGLSAEREVNKKQSDGGKQPPDWLKEVVYPTIINNLRLPVTNQVNVKLSVVEVTKTFTDNVGIDWGSISVSNPDITPGTFRFIKFSADTLSSLVHAIRNDSVARILAEPNLSVMSGETADFLVGGEVPIVTSSSNGTSVSYKEFGIKLNVGARVSSSKRIRITLGEEVSSVDSTYTSSAGMSFPTFQTRRARTTVELADGESFLLGGLISSNEREELARLPFIGDVPLLGALFRNAKTERTQGELVVVATVNLVKPVTTREVTLPDFQRTSTLSRFLNFDGIQDHRNRKMAEEFLEKGGFIK